MEKDRGEWGIGEGGSVLGGRWGLRGGRRQRLAQELGDRWLERGVVGEDLVVPHAAGGEELGGDAGGVGPLRQVLGVRVGDDLVQVTVDQQDAPAAEASDGVDRV